MKLPQYDNRPQPGQPLYNDPTGAEKRAWEDLKFPVLFFGALIGLVVFISLFFSSLLSGLRSLLN